MDLTEVEMLAELIAERVVEKEQEMLMEQEGYVIPIPASEKKEEGEEF